jgi:anaerobic selenocysteine-containing dehydrogenase
MAELADLVLPSTTFLEEWGYDHSSPGAGSAEVRIKQPVVKPIGDSKSIGDILFHLSEGFSESVAKAFKDMGGSAEFPGKEITEKREIHQIFEKINGLFLFQQFQQSISTPSSTHSSP